MGLVVLKGWENLDNKLEVLHLKSEELNKKVTFYPKVRSVKKWDLLLMLGE